VGSCITRLRSDMATLFGAKQFEDLFFHLEDIMTDLKLKLRQDNSHAQM